MGDFTQSNICPFSKEKTSQVLGFINLVSDSHDEDGDIFKSEKFLPDVFYTFVNRGCVKKD